MATRYHFYETITEDGVLEILEKAVSSNRES
jgi:hypothetical protein